MHAYGPLEVVGNKGISGDYRYPEVQETLKYPTSKGDSEQLTPSEPNRTSIACPCWPVRAPCVATSQT